MALFSLFGSPAPQTPKPKAPAPRRRSWLGARREDPAIGQLERMAAQHADARRAKLATALRTLRSSLPVIEQATGGHAMDDDGGDNLVAIKASLSQAQTSFPDEMLGWFTGQGFMGYQMAALVAQHWLIHKICRMPAEDALRKGWDVATIDGESLTPEQMRKIKRKDRDVRIAAHALDFLHKGRVFGVRLAIFLTCPSSDDAKQREYYAAPFNTDCMRPGSYAGIVQPDPIWCAPVVSGEAVSRPDLPGFYEPEYWLVSGRKYHKSHIVIFRNDAPADILKPSYLYGGIPLPQKILAAVYNAERSANEAPALLMTKRQDVWLTDMGGFLANESENMRAFNLWRWMLDNFGIKIGDKQNDSFQRFDTALSDVSDVIMTCYQICAAAGRVPAVKLLETTPKGFNATGEYEQASYHEALQSLQTHGLEPLLERHYLCAAVSELGAADLMLAPVWRPLDAMTELEQAQVNSTKAQTDAALVTAQIITASEARERLARDKTSGYDALGIEKEATPEELAEAAEMAARAAEGEDGGEGG